MTACARGLILFIAAISAVAPLCAVGQEQSTPAASATPAATTRPSPASSNAPAWHNPPNTNLTIIDPCGGPKELINKLNPSPCVFVQGEAMVSAGYANVNTHGSISAGGPLGNTYELPVSGNANIYPSLLIAAGVSATSQLQLTLPSTVDVGTQRLGSINSSTDTAIDYKQQVYFNQKVFTLAAVDIGYTAPTSSSLGPSYHVQPIVTQPLNANVTLGGFWTFQNTRSITGLGVTERGWQDPIGMYLAWSPANASFAFFPLAEHSFNPNRTIVAAELAQLLSRHLLMTVMYGGLGVSASATGAFGHALTFSANANPRIFAATLFFLVGESNLPPEPPPPAPTPTP